METLLAQFNFKGHFYSKKTCKILCILLFFQTILSLTANDVIISSGPTYKIIKSESQTPNNSIRQKEEQAFLNKMKNEYSFQGNKIFANGKNNSSIIGNQVSPSKAANTFTDAKSENNLIINGVKILDDKDFPKGKFISLEQLKSLPYTNTPYKELYYFKGLLKVVKVLNNKNLLCEPYSKSSSLSSLFSDTPNCIFLLSFPYDVPFFKTGMIMGSNKEEASPIIVLKKKDKDKDLYYLNFNGYIEYNGKKYPDQNYKDLPGDIYKKNSEIPSGSSAIDTTTKVLKATNGVLDSANKVLCIFN